MLTLVRMGKFSGIAVSLRAALDQRTQVLDIDVTRAARSPRYVAFRLLGEFEGRLHGTPPAKTAWWSRATESYVRNEGARSPVLYMQTLHAHRPQQGVRYAVFVDRVGLEADALGHRSFSPGWLRREREFLRGAERIFSMGPSTVRFLTAEYGIDRERVEVVGTGINVPRGVRKTASECRRLLFVGREWSRKGGPDLLKAFASLRDKYGLELRIVGSEPADVPPGVVIDGYVPHAEMREVFEWADAFVLPTLLEPFGVAFAEALSYGLPCVGTTVGNVEWIVGTGGTCVPPSDAAALTAAIEQVVTDYPHYRERARRRWNEMEVVFSWETIADRVMSWATGDLGAPAPPPVAGLGVIDGGRHWHECGC